MITADEHTAWPVGRPRYRPEAAGARVNIGYRDDIERLKHVASHLTERPGYVPAMADTDACDRTHDRVRLMTKDAIVHRLDAVIPAPNMSGLLTVYITACRRVFPLVEAVRTGVAITCADGRCDR